MNGPKPVWKLAMKKLSQSSPNRLRASGAAGMRRSTPNPVARDAAAGTSPALAGQRVGGRRLRRGHHRHRLVALRLIGRRRLDLLAAEIERDHLLAVGADAELQGAPLDRYLAAADPEKAAEIDDRRARPALGVDQHLDDAPQILACGAANLGVERRKDL